MTIRIGILGGGVSGLLAAKAAVDSGVPIHKIDIYDKRSLSEIGNTAGLHYLHDNCGLELTSGIIRNKVIWDKNSELSIPKQYCMKIFGKINETSKTNSLVKLPQYNTIYNINELLNWLLSDFKNNYIQMGVDRSMVMTRLAEKYDIIISTIPLHILDPSICCEREVMWVKQGLPERIQEKFPKMELFDHFSAYNVIEDDDWYRASRVFGVEYTEYQDKPEGDAVPINKIITAGIDSFDYHKKHGIFPVGRWGEWNRKRLAHEVYYMTKELMERWKVYAR